MFFGPSLVAELVTCGVGWFKCSNKLDAVLDGWDWLPKMLLVVVEEALFAKIFGVAAVDWVPTKLFDG